MEELSLANLLGASLVLVALGASALIVVYSVRTGISPMPSTRKARAHVLAAVPSDTPGPIYELGSGWGTLAFPLADRFPHCEVSAYELSPLPYLVSRCRQRLSPRPNLVIRRENFLEVPLARASVLVCYLCPPLMRQLAQKLAAEARPDTVVVSNTFSILNWEPLATYALNDLYDTRVYVYRMPAESGKIPLDSSA